MKYLILSILLVSCGIFKSPTQRKLERANRLIKEAVADGAKVNADTIYKDRTVFIKGETVTNTITKTEKDTVDKIIDRIKIREIHHHDTIYQTIQCPDSVVKWKEKTAVNQTINCPEKSDIWKTIAITLLAVLIVFIWVNRK
ncbi:MAG TPA: hypothetical protein VL443_30150 [Cyclobacteriaceae bacterium]|jgi:hypothetical protein|nr:hypothetical protein [Cyclobacteriaceae bacterium]